MFQASFSRLTKIPGVPAHTALARWQKDLIEEIGAQFQATPEEIERVYENLEAEIRDQGELVKSDGSWSHTELGVLALSALNPLIKVTAGMGDVFTLSTRIRHEFTIIKHSQG